MLTCYILDDEIDAIEVIASYIEMIPYLELIGTSQQPLNAIKEISDKRPDILFLDIDMPNLTGLEIADILEDKTNIIFTTGYPNYAFNAFEKKVADFLLKPITFSKLLAAIKNVAFKIEEDKKKAQIDDYFFIKPGTKGILLKVFLKDINYIEGLKNYVIIVTDITKYITYLTMKEIKLVLPSKNFIRIHKSYIVNIDYIKAVNGNFIIMNNQDKLPLGPAFKVPFHEKISQKSLKSSR